MKRIPLTLIVFTTLLALPGFWPAQMVSAGTRLDEQPPVGAPLSPEADIYSSVPPEPKSTITDLFGYSLNNAPISPPAYVPLHGDPTLKLDTNLQFGCVEQPLAFSFPFYESTYAVGQILSICVDGLLVFGSAPPDNYRDFNTDLPFESPPNNLIAPLWDNLAIDTDTGFSDSGIYVRSTASALIVEWYLLIPSGHNTNRLTFEAILYPSGEIDFLYPTITEPMESATIGIEDAGGYTGLRYLYNVDGIYSGAALQISRPSSPTAPRARFLDGHQSELAYGRTTLFPVALQNTGNIEQTYSLTAIFTGPSSSWLLKLCSTSTCSQTVTTTGLLLPQQTFHFYLQMTALPGTPVGNRVSAKVKAAAGLPQLVWETTFETAVPAAFSHAVIDSTYGISQLLVWDTNIYRSRLSTYYPGASMSMTAGKDMSLFAWEWQGTTSPGGVSYTNIMVSTLNRFGQSLDSPTAITDHSQVTVATRDKEPNLVIASDGTMALAFKRERYQSSGEPCYNENIMVSWKKTGQPWTAPFKLTANGDSDWRCLSSPEIPSHYSPRITALADGRYAISWLELKRDLLDSSYLRLIVFDPENPQAPTAEQGYPLNGVDYEEYEYHSPIMIARPTELVLFYVFKNKSTGMNAVLYDLLDTSGIRTGIWGKIEGSNTDNNQQIDAALLTDGKIALAWKDLNKLQVHYTLLSKTSDNKYEPLLAMPGMLQEPHILQADSISVAGTSGGQAVITWGDYVWKRALAYALIGSNGTVATTPILFVHNSSTNPVILTSSTGQGVSAYEGSFRTFGPFVGK